MKLATERQKKKLTELGIEFDGEITLEEAALILRAQLPKFTAKVTVNENALVEMSEVRVGEI